MLGENEKSIKCFQKLPKLLMCEYKGISGLAYVYGKTGQTKKCQEMLELMDYRSTIEDETVLWVDYAMAHAGLGNYSKMIEYLNKAVDSKLPMMVFLKNNLAFREFHDRAEFQLILRKIGQ